MNAVTNSGSSHTEYTIKSLFDYLLLYEARNSCCIGDFSSADEEPIRFRQSLSLAFPTQDAIANYESKGKRQVEQTVIGLNGFDGPLPREWSEDLWQDAKTEQGKIAFLDMFNHRIFLLYWRASANSQLISSVYRTGSILGQLVDSLLVRSQSNNHPEFSSLKLTQNAYWMSRVGSTPLLRGMLRRLLSAQVSISEFYPLWLPLDSDEQSSLSSTNGYLGEDVILGTRVLTRSQAIAINIGPLSSEYYLELIRYENMCLLTDIIRNFLAQPVCLAIKVGIEKVEETPMESLSLGANAWIGEVTESRWDFVHLMES